MSDSAEGRNKALPSVNVPPSISAWTGFRWPFSFPFAIVDKEAAEKIRPLKRRKKSRQRVRSACFEDETVDTEVKNEKLQGLIPSPTTIWSGMSTRAKRNTIVIGFVLIYYKLFESPRIARRRAGQRLRLEVELERKATRYNKPLPTQSAEVLLKHIEAGNKKENENTKPINYVVKSAEESAKRSTKAKAAATRAAESVSAPGPVKAADPPSAPGSPVEGGRATSSESGLKTTVSESGPPAHKPGRRRRRRRRKTTVAPLQVREPAGRGATAE